VKTSTSVQKAAFILCIIFAISCVSSCTHDSQLSEIENVFDIKVKDDQHPIEVDTNTSTMPIAQECPDAESCIITNKEDLKTCEQFDQLGTNPVFGACDNEGNTLHGSGVANMCIVNVTKCNSGCCVFSLGSQRIHACCE